MIIRVFALIYTPQWVCDISVRLTRDAAHTFLLSGCLGDVLHALYALLEQRGRSGDRTQLLPALSHLLLHLLVLGCTARALYQLNTNTGHSRPALPD